MKRVLIPALVLVSLLLGVVDAGARSTATRTVTVEVIGKGTVKSNPSGISCGGGNTKCYAAFADGQDITLTAKPGGGFATGTWGDDCAPDATDVVCDLGSTGNEIATANFDPKSGTTQSTLSITYADDNDPTTDDIGDVTAPEGGPP